MSAFAGLDPPPVLWLAVSVFGSKKNIQDFPQRFSEWLNHLRHRRCRKNKPRKEKKKVLAMNTISKLLRRLISIHRTPAKRKLTTLDHSVTSESLEQRQVMSVTNPWFSGSMLVVPTDNNSTNVELTSSGSNLVVRDHSSNRSWTYSASQVSRVEFQGGNGNDRFINNFYSMPVRAFGGAGNDYLEGYNGNDVFVVVQATTRLLAMVVMISYGVALEMTCCLGEMAMMISWAMPGTIS
jgi:hypothetical protein